MNKVDKLKGLIWLFKLIKFITTSYLICWNIQKKFWIRNNMWRLKWVSLGLPILKIQLKLNFRMKTTSFSCFQIQWKIKLRMLMHFSKIQLVVLNRLRSDLTSCIRLISTSNKKTSSSKRLSEYSIYVELNTWTFLLTIS